MTIEKVRKTITVSIAVFVITALILLLGIVVGYRQWQEVKQEIEYTEAEIVVLEQKLQRLIALKSQDLAVTKQFNDFKEILPDYLDEKEILRIMQRAALMTSCSVEEIRFNDILYKNGYREIPFELVLTGEFHGLLALFNNLEQDAKIFRIDDLSIQSTTDGAEIRANIKLSTFYADDN